MVSHAARKTATRIALLLLAGTLAAGLAGCGRKGALEPHPDSPEARQRPAQNQPVTASSLAPNGGKRRTPPITPPKRPFVLDFLL